MSLAAGTATRRFESRNRGGLLLRYAPFVAGTLLVAGIVHLTAILLAPRMATNSAGRRFSAGEVNVLKALPPTLGPDDLLPTPFADPALVTAVCPYDLSEGPVRVRLQTGDQFLSIVALTPTGRVLMALTDRAATRSRTLNIMLVTPAQQRQLESQDNPEEAAQELRVRIGETKGVAVIRMLALREPDRASAAAMLSRTLCRQE